MFGQSGRQGLLPRSRKDSRWRFEIPKEWDRIVVLANRAPYRHEQTPAGRITQTRTASGLVTALEPLVDACGGVWVAHGEENDHLAGDGRGALDVPAANPRYRIRYVALDPEQHHGFYYGFANEALWPLCHLVHVPAVFRAHDFQHYEAANSRFVGAVAEEAGPGSSLILVQDYHFALAPRRLRKLLPANTVVHFWHVPWPHPRAFRTCPWHRELLDGMLGSDVIGFQTVEDARNFTDSVSSLLHADVDGQHTIRYRGHSTRVAAFPVGIDCDNAIARATPPAPACRAEVLRQFDLPDHVWLGVGVDRLDYTKGLSQKFLAIERALELHPELRRRFAFIQVAEPSRQCLPAYRDARAALHEITARINRRFGTTSHTPIRLLEAHHDAGDIYRLYRAADLCYVGSLHDGMNLVAKEFAFARNDERGVLILSEFAGAAQQLRTAVLVNPYAIDAAAEAIARACTMPAAEQSARMRLLRANVRTFDARWWAERVLSGAWETRHASSARSSESIARCRGSAKRATESPASPTRMLNSRFGGSAANASSSVPSSPT